MSTNPGPVDADRVLKIDENGHLVPRPADEASKGESWHHHFIISTAVVVRCVA